MSTEITPEFREQLKQFCIELNAWIEDGAIYGRPFDNTVGLCGNFKYWKDSDINYHAYKLMGYLFVEEGLDSDYPFGYYIGEEETLYQNPARLAWIKEHMK